ncbi:MAG: ABC transporter permease [Candidatus Alcyoniella australis]|nr:ABC transporter permease [Candidatus Alcyoniella australis]
MRFEVKVGLRLLMPRLNQLLLAVITVICVLGVTVGVGTLILVTSVQEGLSRDMREKFLGAYSHLLVLDPPVFEGWREVLEQVRAFPGIEQASPFVYSEVMISSETGVSGVVLRGIDPDTVPTVVDTLDLSGSKGGAGVLLRGRLADLKRDEDQLPGILLGIQLARDLGVLFEGETVNVISPQGEQTPFGAMPRLKRFEVVGIFEYEMFEFDAKLAYITIPEAQKFFDVGDRITGVECTLNDQDLFRASQIAGQVQDYLHGPFRDRDRVSGALYGATGGVYAPEHFIVKDWEQINRNLFSALKLERLASFLIVGLIVFVAAMNILSILYMNVTNRRQSLAMLKVMGATSGSIMRIVLFHGLIIGLLGSLLGGLLGGSLTWMQETYHMVPLPPEVYNIDHVPVAFSPANYVIIALIAMGSTMFFSALVAMVAGMIDPVRVLRYE